jgi:hypothetical protein
MRTGACAFLCLVSACGGRDHGPPPDADHQTTVRAAMDRVLDGMYRLESPSEYRFAAPVQDKVARWHFEPQVDGQTHDFGYLYGWRVDFWVTPHYAGYPPQPESHRMAFFGGGGLRGLFSQGTGNAPLDLARWSATWVDPEWPEAGRVARPPAGGR